MAKQNHTLQPNFVLGRVADQFNRPLANLTVEVYDKDMRSEVLLAETITSKDGQYKTSWQYSQLTGRNKEGADILIKVYTQEKRTLLFSSELESVRFNAASSEVINITIQNPPNTDAIEFDYILEEVNYLAGEVAVADLQESKVHQDITFLSKEAGINPVKIEHLVVAHRLQQFAKIDADFFYAMLRKNTLLKNNLAEYLHARLSIGINTEIEPLLYDAALADPAIILADIKDAVKEKIVASKAEKAYPKNIELLQKYRKKAEAYYQKEHPEKMISSISRFVLEGKLSEVGKLYKENKNDLNVFFDKISDSVFFSTEVKATDARTNIELGKLFGFGNELVPHLIKSKKISKPQDVRKLASLNKKEWVAELTKAKSKNASDPEFKDSLNLYASAIVRKMEKTYPTIAYTAQLNREKEAVLKNQKAVLSFLNDHEDFDLTNDNIDLFLRTKKITKKESDSIGEDLKSVQRVFKLTPNYSKANALLKENIHSAHQIVALGKTRFLKEMAPKAGIDEQEAKEIFKKAEHTNTAAMILVGELQDTMRAVDIASLETSALALKLESVSKDFPNLKSLFKVADTCACEHCRSVYSPAAYLVEILQFLDKRTVTDLTTNTTANLAKDVLFSRRPDLGEIDLGCENANTPVKYIDLVCELLEDHIAPDKGINYTGDLADGASTYQGKISAALLAALTGAGLPVTSEAQIFETESPSGSADVLPHYLRDKKAVCKIVNTGGNSYKVYRLKQTLSPAEELAAAPEYVNAKAYTALSNAFFAFKLPFDLNHAEGRAYFDRFDTSRADLMTHFQVAADPAYETIAAEILGLTDAERKIIVTPKPALADQQLVWNAPAQWGNPPLPGNVLDYMKRVDHFLEKTSLSYKELDLLLSLKYIDPAKKLHIYNSDLSCDTAKKEIANLNEAALDRIHRFLRLQKKTGWKFEILDEIISQTRLGNKKLDANDDNSNGITNGNECLIAASALKKISEKTGIKIEELIGFYGEIPHEPLNDSAPKPLYQQVFLNKAKNGTIDEGLHPENVNNTQLLASYTTSIAVSLQLKKQEIEKILPLLTDGNLNFANLSYLFAASRLIKKLKLKTDDFVNLIFLTGIDFSESPQKTLEFITEAAGLKESPLKTADIKFMLQHDADNITERELKDEKVKLILEDLQKQYQNNFNTNKSKFDDKLSAEEQKETLQGELSKLGAANEAEALTNDDVKQLVDFIDKEYTSAADAKAFIDSKLGSLFDTAAIKAAIDSLDMAVPASLEIQKSNLAQTFLDALAGHQLLSGKQAILEQSIAAGFKADLELVKITLKYAKLRQPAPGTASIANTLLSDVLIDTQKIDNTHPAPVLPDLTLAIFAGHRSALKLLHKLFPLIGSFNLTIDEIAWYFQNNTSLNWFSWDGIPYQSTHTPSDYRQYRAFAKFIALAKQLPPVPNPADAENPVSLLSAAAMLLPASGASRAQFLEAFSLLATYEKDDIDAIDNHLFPVFNLDHYRDIHNWERVIRCAEHLRTLGSEMNQVIQYIKPVLLAADVNILRSALKSRYSEDTWLETLKEIMDAVRPQKRDALIAYILATNPEIKDENDLFDYFLVDVEMEACMPSSRIVQAHGSIQLFVQRCLMGLEPKAAADLDNDVNWNQWKWMKNYRVWEANRKVFVYPENWIEADLRDEKSFLFTELENELQQNELTEFAAEEALIKYLEKLDNLAFLEVMTSWYQTDIKTMHVFARTKGGDPAIYYYRKFEQERYWTPWEKIELDITGDHLLAFVRNNRLCLAWPVFTEVPDPNPKATLPDQSSSAPQNIDKPKRKLKIQIAISEFANKRWQPKKVSKDGIDTPPEANTYTEGDIPKQNFKFFYNQPGEQIVAFNVEYKLMSYGNGIAKWEPYDVLAGAFDITGCKGYPELAPAKSFSLNFIPQFRDTDLLAQRYKEMNSDAANDLSVINAHSFLSGSSFDQILQETPGTFRLSYPHQFTNIDLIVLFFEYFLLLFSDRSSDSVKRRGLKLTLGTLLPYFKEDSKHAYVIIPGFYKREKDESGREKYILTDAEKRTVSDVFQLLEDISNLADKYSAIIKANPPSDLNAFIQQLISDEDFQHIIAELSAYEGFDLFYDLLIGKTGNKDMDEILKKLKETDGLVYGEQFKNMYHPLVCALRTILYKKGIPELMKRDTQLLETGFNFSTYYKPNPYIVPQSYMPNPDGSKKLTYPVEDLDFSSDGSYSVYNWELFFHVPFLLATRLTKNQRFEESLTWFHYMFNPTGALSGNTPQKYWVTKPFYLNQEADYINQRIDTLLYKIADPTTPERKELEFAIEQWRNKPFKPHVIARFRPVAYQKALLMKYLDNLTEWGDNLFRQDTMESIAQATQMYILADKILGPKPRIVPSAIKAPYETYNQIERKIDAFGNALIGLENMLPDLSSLPENGEELPPSPLTLSMLYFCIPQNEKMLEYWDRIADRLFKIRHCQNIDGVERSLALFAPPIDPAMLVRAAASGLDISSILAGMNAPTPYYRFNVLSQKATELAQEIRGLGGALLQTLEKKDAEALNLLRNELEIKVLNAVKDVKALQINESQEQIEVLKRTKKVTEERHKYYKEIEFMNALETTSLALNAASAVVFTIGSIMEMTAGATANIPDVNIGASGFGGSPHAVLEVTGGDKISSSISSFAKALILGSQVVDRIASGTATIAGYQRRNDDWKLQERLAKKELDSIEKQITAAEIRKEISEADLRSHELQIDNAKKTDEFMRSKFTNKELYDWMTGQISSVYFKSYQLAHDFAKKAERSYRFELGNDDAFISYGYWDSMKKGLQSADHLIHDIKRMETSYLDKNKREYEITKHVSLLQLDPLAIVRLRSTGVCDFDIPEALYDMDHAGQYFRRIKSVSVSLPCIAGPYTSVSAKLSLVNNRYRKITNPDNMAGTGYPEDSGNDERFVYNVGSIQSIAASSSQNDSGVFELNFKDERYLPFEGTGAISAWRLELPAEIRQFDYTTISDVIIHVKYTAREGGSGLKNLANSSLKDNLALIHQQLNQEGLHIAINMKHDAPGEWHLLKTYADVDLIIDKSRFPYMAQTLDTEIEHVMFLAKVKGNPASFSIDIDGATLNLSKVDEWKICREISTDIDLDTAFNLSVAEAQLENLEELILVVKYKFP